jgi:hypothetical protein
VLKSIGQNILVAHFGINDVFNGAIAGGCIPSFVYLCSQLLLCSVSEQLVQVESVINYFGCVLEMAGSQKVSYVFFLFLIEVDVHVILSVSVKLLYKGGYWEVWLIVWHDIYVKGVVMPHSLCAFFAEYRALRVCIVLIIIVLFVFANTPCW